MIRAKRPGTDDAGVKWAAEHPTEAAALRKGGNYTPAAFSAAGLPPIQGEPTDAETRRKFFAGVANYFNAPTEYQEILGGLAKGIEPTGWQKAAPGATDPQHPSVDFLETPWGNYYRFKGRERGAGQPSGKQPRRQRYRPPAARRSKTLTWRQ